MDTRSFFMDTGGGLLRPATGPDAVLFILSLNLFAFH
jgi:hypothetical protein